MQKKKKRERVREGRGESYQLDPGIKKKKKSLKNCAFLRRHNIAKVKIVDDIR